ncbi:MAG: hypothetical protein AAGA48_27695 [Myxococcota bacterium]
MSHVPPNAAPVPRQTTTETQLTELCIGLRHDVLQASMLMDKLTELQRAITRLQKRVRTGCQTAEPAWLDAARLRLGADAIRTQLSMLETLPDALQEVSERLSGTGWTVELADPQPIQ